MGSGNKSHNGCGAGCTLAVPEVPLAVRQGVSQGVPLAVRKVPGIAALSC